MTEQGGAVVSKEGPLNGGPNETTRTVRGGRGRGGPGGAGRGLAGPGGASKERKRRPDATQGSRVRLDGQGARHMSGRAG